MCDTLVALPSVTSAGATLFAKNSDRERDEAQGLEMWPAAAHEPGSPLRLTYISIPQVARTHGCLLSRPFWMWGAEMGANDQGVAIGNEAVHSIVAPSETPALTGMDLVRLGLERGATAVEAVDIMTTLLERHGQGGDCGYREPFHYHNSFIVADGREAYVLETVGRWWAVEKVEGSRAISNILGIGAGASYSADVLAWARNQGLSRDGLFDFAEALMDRERDKTTRGAARCARATRRLAARGSSLAVADLMSILRDHGAEADHDPAWTPAALVGRTICMHAGPGDRRSQTVGSMTSELRAGGAVHWVTASAAPCLSIFKPVTFASGLPDQGPPPTRLADRQARWYAHEEAHRGALIDFATRLAEFAPLRDRLEAGFRERMSEAAIGDLGGADLRARVEVCWREADAARQAWAKSIEPQPGRPRSARAYFESWGLEG